MGTPPKTVELFPARYSLHAPYLATFATATWDPTEPDGIFINHITEAEVAAAIEAGNRHQEMAQGLYS